MQHRILVQARTSGIDLLSCMRAPEHLPETAIE